MANIYLIRGLPGSGKSTLAHTMYEYFSQVFMCEHIEADMYFITKDGQYAYNPDLIGAAHDWCQNRVKQAMYDRTENIIVANTFTRRWELLVYEEMAAIYGYKVFEFTCTGKWQSIHGVPEETINKMRARWQS